jgi:hypothetical protein
MRLVFLPIAFASKRKQSLEQLAKELLGSVLVAPTLDKDIKHVAILINGSPEIVGLPIDFEKDLIKMPFVAGLAATMLQFSGIRLSEFQAPLPYRFIGQHDSTFSHDLFNITETEGETKIQPAARFYKEWKNVDSATGNTLSSHYNRNISVKWLALSFWTVFFCCKTGILALRMVLILLPGG